MKPDVQKSTKLWHFILMGVCVFLLILFSITMFANVILRFVFQTGFVPVQDLLSYVFAVFIMLSIAYASVSELHVSALNLQLKDRETKKLGFAKVAEAVLGMFSFLLIPYVALPEVISSWRVLEGSAEPNGLGGYFLVRTVLPISALLIVAYFGVRLSKQLFPPRRERD